MGAHWLSLVTALGIGVFGFVAMFAVGSHTGSGGWGMLAAGLSYLLGAMWLQYSNPRSWWYGGFAINVPIWFFFLLLADRGQFQLYVMWLIACVIASYAGSLLGSRLPRRSAP